MKELFKKSVILLFFFPILEKSVVWGQQYSLTIDSLLEVSAKQKDDTAKVATWIAVAENSRNTNPDLCKTYAEKAIILSEKLNYVLGIGRAQFVLAKSFQKKGDFKGADSLYRRAALNLITGGDTSQYSKCIGYNGMTLQSLERREDAVSLLKEGLNRIKQSSNEEWIYTVSLELASTYSNMGLDKLAIPLLENCLLIAEKLKIENLYVMAVNNLGNAYERVGKVDKSLEFLLKALAYFREKQSPQEEAIIHMNIGKVYGGMNDLERSSYHFLRAHQLHDPQKNLVFSAKLKGNLANIMIRKKQIDSAITWVYQAIEMSMASNHKPGVAGFYQLLGEAYFAKEKFEEAGNSLTNALKLFDELGLLNSRIAVRRDLADVRIKQKRYNEAAIYLKEALELAKITESNYELAKVYGSLYFLESERAEYKRALEYHVLYKSHSDSILNEDKIKQIETLRVEFDIDEKEKELELLSAKNMLQTAVIAEKESRNANLILLLVLILALSLSSTVILVQKARNKSRTRELKTKLYALRSQVNPHFIFNSLSSIHAYMTANKTEYAGDYLLRFSKLMRLILDHTRSELIDLESELEIIELYLELERERMANKFSYVITIDESLRKNETLIPPMMIQPLIENAIWHGISPLTDRDGFIEITLSEESNILTCIVQDNGIGMPVEQTKELTVLRKHPSHGIQITRERIELINQKSRRKGKIIIENTNPGVASKITIPLK